MPRYLRGIFLCFLGAGLSQPTLLHASAGEQRAGKTTKAAADENNNDRRKL